MFYVFSAFLARIGTTQTYPALTSHPLTRRFLRTELEAAGAAAFCRVIDVRPVLLPEVFHFPASVLTTSSNETLRSTLRSLSRWFCCCCCCGVGAISCCSNCGAVWGADGCTNVPCLWPGLPSERWCCCCWWLFTRFGTLAVVVGSSVVLALLRVRLVFVDRSALLPLSVNVELLLEDDWFMFEWWRMLLLLLCIWDRFIGSKTFGWVCWSWLIFSKSFMVHASGFAPVRKYRIYLIN